MATSDNRGDIVPTLPQELFVSREMYGLLVIKMRPKVLQQGVNLFCVILSLNVSSS